MSGEKDGGDELTRDPSLASCPQIRKSCSGSRSAVDFLHLMSVSWSATEQQLHVSVWTSAFAAESPEERRGTIEFGVKESRQISGKHTQRRTQRPEAGGKAGVSEVAVDCRRHVLHQVCHTLTLPAHTYTDIGTAEYNCCTPTPTHRHRRHPGDKSACCTSQGTAFLCSCRSPILSASSCGSGVRVSGACVAGRAQLSMSAQAGDRFQHPLSLDFIAYSVKQMAKKRLPAKEIC